VKKILMAGLLGLTTSLGGLVTTPTEAKADYYYPSYHYEYRTVWVKIPYTAYDHCGHPYTAYKYVPIRKLVKVYGP